LRIKRSFTHTRTEDTVNTMVYICRCTYIIEKSYLQIQKKNKKLFLNSIYTITIEDTFQA